MEALYKIDLNDLVADSSDESSISEIEIASEIIYQNSQLVVPYDTGRLLDSGFVEYFGDYAVIGYETDYACFVHEIKENVHARGKAKFLEDCAVDYIKSTHTNLSLKITLNKLGVYLYITTQEKAHDFGGLELNSRSHLINEFNSFVSALQQGGD